MPYHPIADPFLFGLWAGSIAVQLLAGIAVIAAAVVLLWLVAEEAFKALDHLAAQARRWRRNRGRDEYGRYPQPVQPPDGGHGNTLS